MKKSKQTQTGDEAGVVFSCTSSEPTTQTSFFKVIDPRPFGKQVWQDDAGAAASLRQPDMAISQLECSQCDLIRGEAIVSLASDMFTKELAIPEKWVLPRDLIRMDDILQSCSEWRRVGSLVELFGQAVPGHDADQVNRVVAMLVREYAFESADVAATGTFFLLANTPENAPTLECLGAMQALGFTEPDIDIGSQSSWRLTRKGRSQLFLNQRVERVGTCLSATPLDGDPEKAYSASTWQLLYHLQTDGWQLSCCASGTRSRTLAPFCADAGVTQAGGGVAATNFYLKQTAKSIDHAYLVLLSSAPMISFSKPIPHLSRHDVYQTLLDDAFPHHVSEEKKTKLMAIQDMECDADIMKLLEGIPDPRRATFYLKRIRCLIPADPLSSPPPIR